MFRALNRAEVVLVVLTTVAFFFARAGIVETALLAALWVILLVQLFGLRPRLDTRAQRIIGGATQPRSRAHLVYIALEAAKVLALSGFGTASARRPAVKYDLVDRQDVVSLVTAFYREVYADTLLRPIFADIAQLDLAAHLPVMTDFWKTALFRTGTYRRNALRVHVALDRRVALTEQHFARWLTVWTCTVDDLFAGEEAELAKT